MVRYMKYLSYSLIVLGFAAWFLPFGLAWLKGDESYEAYMILTGPVGVCFIILGLLFSHMKESDNTMYMRPKHRILGAHVNPGVAIVLLLVAAPIIGAIVEWLR